LAAIPITEAHGRPRRRTHRTPPVADRGWLLRCYLLRSSDAVASAVIMYAVPLLVLTITHSAAWTGMAFLVEWGPRLVAIAGAGPLIDRHSPQSAVLGTSLLRAAASLGAMVGLAFGVGVGAVMAFGVVTGMLAEASFLAVESLGAEASRRAGPRAHQVQATLTSIDQTALLLGPLLGGALLLVSPALLLSTVIVLSAVTSTVALVLRTERPRLRVVTGHEQQQDSPLAALTAGLGTLRRTPALAWLVAALAAGNLVSGVLQVSTPITVTVELGHSSAAVGAVWSIAAGASLAAVAMSRRAVDRYGLYPVGLAAAVLMCAATLAAGLAPSLTPYTSAIAALMAAEGALTVVLRTARARLIPERGFAAALAVTVLLVLAPLPLAGLLVAAVPRGHLQGLVLAVGGVEVIVTAICYRGLWRHRADYEQTPVHEADHANQAQAA